MSEIRPDNPDYLTDENCDRYLATKAQVDEAGYSRFLSARLRETDTPESASHKSAPNSSRAAATKTDATTATRGAQINGSWMALAGATIGAAGWIIGLAIAPGGFGRVTRCGSRNRLANRGWRSSRFHLFLPRLRPVRFEMTFR